MITTVVMLILSFVAFLAIIDMKYKKLTKPSLSLNNMSAEDLLEVIVGLPLNELLTDGDSIEIVISTNGHAIASREYVATDWHSMVKLEPVKSIKG